MNSHTIATSQLGLGYLSHTQNARTDVPKKKARTGEPAQKTLYTTSQRLTSLPNRPPQPPAPATPGFNMDIDTMSIHRRDSYIHSCNIAAIAKIEANLKESSRKETGTRFYNAFERAQLCE
jgi:hypothetical protein